MEAEKFALHSITTEHHYILLVSSTVLGGTLEISEPCYKLYLGELGELGKPEIDRIKAGDAEKFVASWCKPSSRCLSG